jgi:hypothetical protein
MRASICSRSEPGRVVACRPRPGIQVEVEAADGGVARGVISVREFRFGGEITFKLDPVQAADIPGGVGFDESVEFAISDVIENPAVGTDISG